MRKCNCLSLWRTQKLNLFVVLRGMWVIIPDKEVRTSLSGMITDTPAPLCTKECSSSGYAAEHKGRVERAAVGHAQD